MRGYLAAKEQVSDLRSVAESVKAMEQAAASHVHRLRQETGVREGYFEEVAKVLGLFARHYRVAEHKFFRAPEEGAPRLLVVVFGERGLVGGLYNDIMEKALALRPDYQRVVVVGARGSSRMASVGWEPEQSFDFDSETVNAESSRAVSEYLINAYLSEGVRSDVLYANFQSFVSQRPKVRSFLPVTLIPESVRVADRPIGWPIMEPNRSLLAQEILTRYLNNFFLAILSDAKLSELAARTVAMEHAAAQAEKKADRAMHDYFKERRREVSRRQIESFFAHLSV